ncbi:nucleotide exchange factor GrpE [Candidatus Dependentiae bacterium]|nr:nucleotide exchange factor GrpE [Candidatus Dependentiae bacterium]
MSTETPLNEQETTQHQSTLTQAEQLAATLKEQLLRTTADFENFRKRTEKERIEWMNITRATTIRLFLPINDDIDRALATLPAKNEQHDSLITSAIDGLSLIQKNISKALESAGVEEIPTNGQFNPEFHEALMQVELTEKSSGEIVQTFEKGYKLGTNIIRHAKVSVAK